MMSIWYCESRNEIKLFWPKALVGDSLDLTEYVPFFLSKSKLFGNLWVCIGEL